MASQIPMSSNSKNGETNGIEKKRLCVLIVDDDPTLQMIHSQLMNAVGLKVETHVAKNGKVAVDICRSATSFDIIFMDMEMPEKNGIEATKEIRDMGIESMIVGVTSVSSGSQLEAFKAAGLNLCFEKPLTVEKIKFVLSKLKNN